MTSGEKLKTVRSDVEKALSLQREQNSISKKNLICTIMSAVVAAIIGVLTLHSQLHNPQHTHAENLSTTIPSRPSASEPSLPYDRISFYSDDGTVLPDLYGGLFSLVELPPGRKVDVSQFSAEKIAARSGRDWVAGNEYIAAWAQWVAHPSKENDITPLLWRTVAIDLPVRSSIIKRQEEICIWATALGRQSLIMRITDSARQKAELLALTEKAIRFQCQINNDWSLNAYDAAKSPIVFPDDVSANGRQSVEPKKYFLQRNPYPTYEAYSEAVLQNPSILDRIDEAVRGTRTEWRGKVLSFGPFLGMAASLNIPPENMIIVDADKWSFAIKIIPEHVTKEHPSSIITLLIPPRLSDVVQDLKPGDRISFAGEFWWFSSIDVSELHKVKD